MLSTDEVRSHVSALGDPFIQVWQLIFVEPHARGEDAARARARVRDLRDYYNARPWLTPSNHMTDPAALTTKKNCVTRAQD